LARRHAVFAVLAGLGLLARACVVASYRPALLYLGDSAAYLKQAGDGLWPGDWRPAGYPMFLLLIDGHHHLTRLVVVQHLLTFAAAVAVYAAALRALRRGDGSPGRRWVAALAAAPALLSPWVLDLGQFVLADSLFSALVAAGVAVLARPGRPRAAACAAGGVLLGAAVVVRTVGYGPLAVAVVVLAAAALREPRRARAAAVAVFAAAAAVPMLGYSAWSASRGGAFSVSAHSGFFLYGRVAPFADCSVLARAEGPEARLATSGGQRRRDDVFSAPPEARLATLCDPRPVAQRPQPDVYLWSDDAPLRAGADDLPPGREELAGRFAWEVVRAQPWMLVRTTGGYLAGYFSPVRHENAKTSRAATWELPDATTNRLPADDPHHFDGHYVVAELAEAPASALNAGSRLSYAPMPLVGAGLAAGLVASAVGWRLGRPGPGRLFWLSAGAGMSVLAVGALTAGFDYRYLASVVALLGAGSVLGAAGLVRLR
jgi:hypothetical protein